MPEQTQSNIEQTPLVHQPAPAVANPPPQSTNPPPKPPQNGNRDSDSEGDEPEVARDVAIGGMGAIVGGVVVGTTMMKLGTASGSNSDDAAKELEALKGDMVEVPALKFAKVGEVKKDTLKKAITDAINDAKGTNNAGAASGGNSDVAAKELQALKGDMVKVPALKFAEVGQVNKDTLKAAITNAIENAKSAVDNTAAASANSVTDLQSKVEAAKKRLAEITTKEEQFKQQKLPSTANIAMAEKLETRISHAKQFATKNAEEEKKLANNLTMQKHVLDTFNEVEEQMLNKKAQYFEIRKELANERTLKEELKEVLKTLAS